MDSVTQASREAIRVGSKSFAAAASLFDRRTRESAWRLYAWCRHCDDVIDGQVLGHGQDASRAARAERLEELRALTRAALDGDGLLPPEFEAFRRVARAHSLDPRHPLALLDGFEMDVEGRGCRDLTDTLLYSWHVAGVVGIMMAQVMGVRNREALDRASDLGIAFQLTNISRDVMEDARAGRLYLPADWLQQAGVAPSPRAVLGSENREAVASVVARLLDVADAYYASARTGITFLPLRAAWAISAARDIYREIGRDVRRQGRAAWEGRAGASSARKAVLLGRGGLVALATRLPLPATPREGLWTAPG